MELKDTVNMMLSDDSKQRFIAEYTQVVIRREKLALMIDNMVQGTLTFKPSSEQHIYLCQVAIMDSYISILKHRAHNEGIELPDRRKVMGWT